MKIYRIMKLLWNQHNKMNELKKDLDYYQKLSADKSEMIYRYVKEIEKYQNACSEYEDKIQTLTTQIQIMGNNFGGGNNFPMGMNIPPFGV